ncbi:restriction endonuclease [Cytobacillus sp. S13-E01]|uniref:restriction endonuclease n=1 Tax=Cytobacillus sp. S13-E01 TaxID=3031326 RepID=UPI0023D86EC3|nr:restriction endonuclease [Cytobacillus sp. S13-E01]MDF0727257.1 restriction endonuclease [Cytobacillus sp. S13-E01]
MGYYRKRRYKKKTNNKNVPANRRLQMYCSKHGELIGYTQSFEKVIYESFNNDKKKVELKCYRCLEEQISEEQNEVSRKVVEKFGNESTVDLSSRAYKYNWASAISLMVTVFGSMIIWANYNMELALLNAGLFGVLAFILWRRCDYLEKKSNEISSFRRQQSIHIPNARSIVEAEANIVSKWRIEQARIKKEKMNYSMEEIDKMTGEQFEHFVKNLLQKNGYENPQITKASGDEGVDIITYKNGKKIAVQCKRYSNKITNSAIQEVFSGMHFYNCHEAYVITNSYFTENANTLANKHKVKLINRDGLFELMEKAGTTKRVVTKTHAEYQAEFMFDK